MVEYTGRDLRGSHFHEVDLSGARFRNIDLTGAHIRGAILTDADITGDLDNVRVNGIEIGPLVDAELDRRYPERRLLRPTDADGFRTAWDVIERSWPATVDRARRLPPDALHVRVDDEWSFIETLRHLVFVVDAWIKRALLDDPDPYDPLDLPHTEMAPDPAVPDDPDARPSLDTMLTLRADWTAVVRRVLAELTDERLAGTTAALPAPGYPPAGTYDVRRCLRAVLNEEWEHRLIAERDLATLESHR